MSIENSKFKPVRDVGMMTSKGSYHGFVWSYTAKRSMGCESSLEGDAIVLLDTDPSVTWMCEQPYTFQMPVDGKTVNYTPDLAVVRNGKVSFVDIKFWDKANKPDQLLFYARAKKFFAEMGSGFVVLTEREIRCQPRLRNAELIRRYGKEPCNRGHVLRLLDASGGSSQVTFGQIKELSAANDNIPDPCSFINSGYAVTDMSVPLNDNSVVEINHQAN